MKLKDIIFENIFKYKNIKVDSEKNPITYASYIFKNISYKDIKIAKEKKLDKISDYIIFINVFDEFEEQLKNELTYAYVKVNHAKLDIVIEKDICKLYGILDIRFDYLIDFNREEVEKITTYVFFTRPNKDMIEVNNKNKKITGNIQVGVFLNEHNYQEFVKFAEKNYKSWTKFNQFLKHSILKKVYNLYKKGEFEKAYDLITHDFNISIQDKYYFCDKFLKQRENNHIIKPKKIKIC